MIEIDRIERFSGKDTGDVIELTLYDGAMEINIDTRTPEWVGGEHDGGYVEVVRHGEQYEDLPWEANFDEDADHVSEIDLGEDLWGVHTHVMEYAPVEDDGWVFTLGVGLDRHQQAVMVDTVNEQLRVMEVADDDMPHDKRRIFGPGPG
ncbi:hypothetical protein [Halomicrobium sp. LC1Hm]|uniref:hypothetical protein n=1 Tax=Halomicrobium sp. LC1Hm TaxID=2610902 RepID=UPI001298265E|nr:hypothetical protein [Halomicrobium sp. LC1Hm]QGA81997.1 hypothetical protein LC1Hm_0935 [Halomicrobium sp. LC1Hm]